MSYARKGDKLQCDSCYEEVYEFTANVEYYDSPDTYQLEGINGFVSPVYGEEALCPNCGASLLPGGHNVVRS